MRTLKAALAAALLSLTAIPAAAAAPALCGHHAEHYDHPFGPKPGEIYISACTVGNGGGWDYGQSREEEPEEPAPAP